MMMTEFISEIEDHLATTGTKPSSFGRAVLNDPGFVYRLRDGAECRPSTIEKVRSKIAEMNGVVHDQSPVSAPSQEAS
ncbi:hypothetical protein [uncultured Mameliella sp.]|uniref:hypothetical protein n=1 Tax=uncultured Mameliella sp. TaxID=1447087 RepID=UPI00262003E9|nr:hypothetical protein [uncultured Mameliella sp.]